MREATCERSQLHPAEAIKRSRACILTASKEQRQLDILDGGQRMEQLERLEDETDIFAPHAREFGV
jgi:hypothetical protein